MEQQLDLGFPKKCMEARENLEETNKMVIQAMEVLVEQAKYIGSEKGIKGVEALNSHVQENLVPSNKETAEFYGQTGEEAQRLIAALN